MKFTWHKSEFCDGLIRHRLYVDGIETPYFIDEATQIQHRSFGMKFGLMGAGMGKEIKTAKGNYRIAAELGGYDRIRQAKDIAESYFKPAAMPVQVA